MKSLMVFLIMAQVIVTPTTDNKPDIATEAATIEVIGKVADEWHKWLWIGRINKTAKPERGFDPSFTFIICDYKPMVKKLKDGRWQIQFTSEIAENIP
jgi:hypothetical protein